jgi:hypothetical protein
MKMHPVDSSVISHVGYDSEGETLRLQFHSGRTYDYSGVTSEQHAGMMAAPSLGKHFGSEIRGKFPHSEV